MTSNRVFKIFYEGYSKKQWGKYYEGILEESPDIILGRCSVRRNSCDCRYFTDEFQGVPLHGYTNMFNNMLRSNKIKVLLKTSAKEVLQDNFKADRIIYTGSIDEWYNYRFGKLEYRGMRFDFETYDRRVCSPYPVINYPDEEASFTRTVEFKHITGQEHDKTTVMTEFPCDDSEDKHYPIYDSRNLSLVAKYKKLMKSDKRVASGKLTFMGRLGSYSYLNMDQCVHTAMYV
jgi:UDP-galactopyranose mutase